jgi:zinc transport system substrate-binding protein
MRHWAVIGLLLFALAGGGQAAEGGAVKAFVSIAPQKYFVEKIGAGLVAVSVLVPPGADAHTFEPRPRQMAELAGAAVFFTVGIDFEKAWMKKISAANPALRIVATDAGIAKIAVDGDPVPAAAGHGSPAGGKKPEPGHAGHDHRPGMPDPHIWLSPPLVKIQARHMADGLATADPAHRGRYADNLEAFLKEIDTLDADLKAVFAESRGAHFLTFHPSWGYFAQAYGLKQVSIEIEGKEPKPAQLKERIGYARKLGARVVFVQPQLSAKSAELVAREIGAEVVSADPLAENWAANLRAIAHQFKAALR